MLPATVFERASGPPRLSLPVAGPLLSRCAFSDSIAPARRADEIRAPLLIYTAYLSSALVDFVTGCLEPER
ncbi:MAG: hypothetical protein ACODAA_09600 [Gemmatimonadota bacterium]